MNAVVLYIAIPVFFVTVAISRILNERALRLLDDAQKVKLLDAYSGMRAYSMLPMLLILGVMFGLPMVMPSSSQMNRWASMIGLALMLLYVVLLHLLVTRKMNTLQLPTAYTRRFLVARHISHLGVFAVLVALMFA